MSSCFQLPGGLDSTDGVGLNDQTDAKTTFELRLRCKF